MLSIVLAPRPVDQRRLADDALELVNLSDELELLPPPSNWGAFGEALARGLDATASSR
jgi:hypothetical protein